MKKKIALQEGDSVVLVGGPLKTVAELNQEPGTNIAVAIPSGQVMLVESVQSDIVTVSYLAQEAGYKKVVARVNSPNIYLGFHTRPRFQPRQ